MTVASVRESARGFDTIPPIHDMGDDVPSALRFVWEVLNQLMRGKTNNVGSVTLRTANATTVVTDERAGNESWIGLMATNALAGGELGIYISARGKQTFTINHGVGAGTRTFDYVIVG